MITYIKRTKTWLIILFLGFSGHLTGAQTFDSLERPFTREFRQLRSFLQRKDSLEIQIIYTQINRRANNMPVFRTYYYNVDSNRYFYPASTVKLPLVLLALEKLNELHIPGLDKYTPMFSDSVYSGQQSVRSDSTAENGLPSIAHYIKKILVSSDNDAYNRLYEFLGQGYINKRLREKGYHSKILHRFDRSLTPDENRHTEAIRFVRNNTLIFHQPMTVSDSIPYDKTILKGVAFYRGDSLINAPFDFTYKNAFPLEVQQQLLKALIFPQAVSPASRFNITPADREFVLRYMSQLPTETNCPPYREDSIYYPAFAKFLMFGEDRYSLPKQVRIFNKVGDAYGFMIDNAYIVDFKHGIEFMLSAVILANTDGIYNDSDYQYESIGFPFMKDLGQMIYQYELRRKRIRKPDLREFLMRYDRSEIN